MEGGNATYTRVSVNLRLRLPTRCLSRLPAVRYRELTSAGYPGPQTQRRVKIRWSYANRPPPLRPSHGRLLGCRASGNQVS
jgi:hypothetical protein